MSYHCSRLFIGAVVTHYQKVTEMTDFTKRALISVSDKTGIADFAKELSILGYEILSTGGTYRHLAEKNVPVIEVSSYTEFPEMMDGRVKTLHPKIHGGILGRPQLDTDVSSMKEHGIIPFGVVVVNLYPFEQTVARPDVSLEDAIENIDIGGPSMVRSAAKNHESVAIVTQPEQYKRVISALKSEGLSLELKRELAFHAFKMTARYDSAISQYFEQVVCASHTESTDTVAEFPTEINLTFNLKQNLRYGENNHQQAAFYASSESIPGTIAQSRANKRERTFLTIIFWISILR